MNSLCLFAESTNGEYSDSEESDSESDESESDDDNQSAIPLDRLVSCYQVAVATCQLMADLI